MPSGNNITDLIRFVRMDIGDDGSTQTYSDTQLMTMIAKASIRVDAALAACITSKGGTAASGGFVQFVQASSGSTFLASGTFVLPTGASSSGLPDPLFNLLLLKTECMLAKRAHFDAAGKGIRVRDGDTEIDTSVSFGGLRSLVNDPGGPCAEYQEALKSYCDWVYGETQGDISQYAAVIWSANMKKRYTHTEASPDGTYQVEFLGTFQDYLQSNENETIDPNNTDRSV